MVLKYQLPGHSMEELISLRSNDDLEEFKVLRRITSFRLDRSIICHILCILWRSADNYVDNHNHFLQG